MKTPYRSVEEVADIIFDDCLAELDLKNRRRLIERIITQERQRCDEMVEVVRISEHPERLALWNEAVEEGRRRERGHIQKVIDGHKVVYRTGDERFDKDAEDGDEKDHIDSCCNETIDEILKALTQPNNPEKPINDGMPHPWGNPEGTYQPNNPNV